jgi:AraC-like DNA-binding protein
MVRSRTLLSFRRSVSAPGRGVVVAIHDVTHPLFRVRVVQTSVIYDDALLCQSVPWSGFGHRPQLCVLLQGAMRLRQGPVERWIRPGHFAVGRSIESLYTRIIPDALMLYVDWDGRALGGIPHPGLPDGVLGETDREFLHNAASQLLSAHGEAIASRPVVEAIVDRLRAVGLPFHRNLIPDLSTTISLRDSLLARVLGHRLSMLQQSPGLIDLQSDLMLSPRQTERAIAAFCERHGQNGENWRTLLDRWRIVAAMVLLELPRSRTEDVARQVGYSSPTVLCRAFQRASLPSPSRLRESLKDLD